MRKALMDCVVAFWFGLAASIAWGVVVMVAFGEYHHLTIIIFYVMGLPIAAAVGFALGVSRGAHTSIVTVCLGWGLSLFICPPALILSNPDNSMDRLEPIILLALAFCAGIYGTLIGVHFSQSRSRKLVVWFIIITTIVTIATITGMASLGQHA